MYDPHRYAWAPYEQYVTRYGKAPKRVVLLGMNPGPFGMMQTGVPFGEVAAVRDWMGIRARVNRPTDEHAKRNIQGFDCARSEVSGRRLWGWAATRFGTAERFFTDWFVLNYCPLALLEESGRNFTPDKLPRRFGCATLRRLRPPSRDCAACADPTVGDRHRRLCGKAHPCRAGERPGGRRARARIRAGCVLHPSPASPLANRGWAEAAEKQFATLGVPGFDLTGAQDEASLQNTPIEPLMSICEATAHRSG